MAFDEERKPDVFSMRNLMLALALHVVAFLLLWLFSILHFETKETVIPIELVFEAPPDEVAPDEARPEPEPPKVSPKAPEPPPAVDEKVDAVVRVKEEKKPEKKKPDPPKEKPKPEPKPKELEKPKKTQEQIKKEKEEARKKRLREMREGAKIVKNPKPPPVVGTGAKLDPNWEKMLNQGYKPSDRTQLATDEKQRCVSLIKAAFYEKWNRPPWTDTLRKMDLQVYFGPGGRVVSYRLVKGSGDAKADLTVINAAKSVRYVYGLSESFIGATTKEGVIVRFDVTPQ